MPDVDPPPNGQLSIDVEALGSDPMPGRAPLDPEAFDQARADFYRELLDTLPIPPACLPDHGVHVYLDHRGRGPCLCKSTLTNTEGV